MISKIKSACQGVRLQARNGGRYDVYEIAVLCAV